MSGIVALAGAGEYSPETTIPPVAARLALATALTAVVRVSDIADDVPDFPISTFGDLGVLRDADLLLLALRFRHLADDELTLFKDYVESGRPVMALRTSSHPFQQPPTSAVGAWAAEFPRTYLGTPWIEHHGHTSTTRITAVGASPLLAGIPDEFDVSSWLYVTTPPEDATIVLWGDPIDPEISPTPSAVAWTRQLGDQRIFYTSLGSESDLDHPLVLRMLENAARWCLGLPVSP